MRTTTLLVFCCATALGDGPKVAAQASAEASPPEHGPSAQEAPRKTLQQYGATFVLAGSSRDDVVDTEEYVLEGEAADAWTHRLTYQRIRLADIMAADHYVNLLKSHMEQAPRPPRFRIVQQGRSASIFGVHYPPSDTSPEQLALALVTIPDERRPNEIHLVQFSLQPGRLSAEEVEVAVKRWQARFQSQAASLER